MSDQLTPFFKYKINKVIFIDEDKFDLLISDSRYIDAKAKTGHKRLNPNALNEHLNDELAKEENRNIKITHLSSTINQELTRKDSKYLTAYGKCSFSPFCQVNYIFRVKEKIVDDNKVAISVEISNYHDHDTQDKDIKKLKNGGVQKTEKKKKSPSVSKCNKISQECKINEIEKTYFSNKIDKNKPKSMKSIKHDSILNSDIKEQEDVNGVFKNILQTDFSEWVHETFSLFDNIENNSDGNYSDNQTNDDFSIDGFQFEILNSSEKRSFEDLEMNEPFCSIDNSNSLEKVYLGPTIHKRMSICTYKNTDITNLSSSNTEISCNCSHQKDEWDEIMNTILEKDLPIFHPEINLIDI